MSYPPVLMYHHVYGEDDVGDVRHPHSYLPLAELRWHLDLLQRWRCQTLTLAEALAAPGSRRRSVVLTFDDGCRCFADLVATELLARNQRATLFVVSGEIGGTNRWDQAAGERREELLGVEELRELARSGLEIACHSRSHPNLTRCADDLEAEVAGAGRELEALLQVPVRTFCYPYGAVDARVRRAVERAGYCGAVAIFGKPNASLSDRFALARMIVRPAESRLELALKTRRLYPLWSRLPRIGLLQALRRARRERRA